MPQNIALHAGWHIRVLRAARAAKVSNSTSTRRPSTGHAICVQTKASAMLHCLSPSAVCLRRAPFLEREAFGPSMRLELCNGESQIKHDETAHCELTLEMPSLDAHAAASQPSRIMLPSRVALGIQYTACGPFDSLLSDSKPARLRIPWDSPVARLVSPLQPASEDLRLKSKALLSRFQDFKVICSYRSNSQ